MIALAFHVLPLVPLLLDTQDSASRLLSLEHQSHCLVTQMHARYVSSAEKSGGGLWIGCSARARACRGANCASFPANRDSQHATGVPHVSGQAAAKSLERHFAGSRRAGVQLVISNAAAVGAGVPARILVGVRTAEDPGP